MKENRCTGCKATHNSLGCYIQNKVEAYDFGPCPCWTCLIRVTCKNTCTERNNLHVRIWHEWQRGNKRHMLKGVQVYAD